MMDGEALWQWNDIQMYPDSKVHGANMGLSGANRTQVGPMLAP